jgi:diguanylate cyclase (GGDEF)-like protein
MLKLLADNYILIVLLIGFVILLSNSLKTDKNWRNNRLKELLAVIVCLVISSSLKTYYDSLSYYSFGRTLTYFICYTLRPAVIILFTALLCNKKFVKRLSYLCIINTAVYITCFFNGLAFSFNEANVFIRGPLCYTAHIFCLFYFLVLLSVIVKQYSSQNRMRTIVLLSFMLFCAVASSLDMAIDNVNIFDSVILICGLEFYLYLYIEHNKMDVMTNAFNRAAFYNDIIKLYNNVTSIISIDMNDLKKINDTQGHDAGDLAISVVSDILLSIDNRYVRIYRIGGDEFVALCFYKDKTNVQSFITQAKEKLAETKYTCSFGFVYNDYKNDLYKLYKKADKKMYIEKEAYHKKYGRYR